MRERHGRTERSKGLTTVGPLTTAIEPNTSAIAQGKSKTKRAVIASRAQVINTPTVISRVTTAPWPRMSEILSVKPPSKRMIATESETKGNNRSPNKASASKIILTEVSVARPAIGRYRQGPPVQQSPAEFDPLIVMGVANQSMRLAAQSGVHCTIATLPFYQFIMSAAFDDHALLNHQNLVCLTYCG